MPQRRRPARRVKREVPLSSRVGSVLASRAFCGTIVIGLLLGGAAYGALFSSQAEVRKISVEGAVTLPADEVREVVARSYPREVPGSEIRSIATADTREAARKLRDAFPKISSVMISRNIVDREIVVALKERTREVVWCPERCFAVDGEGVVFEETERTSPVLSGVSGETELGSSVVSEKTMEFLLRARDIVGGTLPVEHPVPVIEFSADREVGLISAEGWRAKFDLREPLEWQLDKLRTVLQQEIPPEERPQLRYIDLRFGDQVYYK